MSLCEISAAPNEVQRASAVVSFLLELGFTLKKPRLTSYRGIRRGERELWLTEQVGKTRQADVHVTTMSSFFVVNKADSYWRVRFDIWIRRNAANSPHNSVCSSKLTSWYRLANLDKAAADLRNYVTKKLKPEQRSCVKKNYERLLYVYRKHNGDDLYSWAVFRRGSGSPVCTGMSQTSARHLARELHDELMLKKRDEHDHR